jgi:hypothetical protein
MQVKDAGFITPPPTTPSGRILLMAILNSAGRITGEVCRSLSTDSLQNFEAQVNNKRKFSILSECKIFS